MSSATPPHHPREGSKNVKFSEMLVNVLEQRLENIAMGKDSAYSNQLKTAPVCDARDERKDPNTHRGRQVEGELANHIVQFVKLLPELSHGVN